MKICIKCGFWRPKNVLLIQKVGWCVHWKEPIEVLKPREDSWWDKDELNRPSVIKVNGIYKMWYSDRWHLYK